MVEPSNRKRREQFRFSFDTSNLTPIAKSKEDEGVLRRHYYSDIGASMSEQEHQAYVNQQQSLDTYNQDTQKVIDARKKEMEDYKSTYEYMNPETASKLAILDVGRDDYRNYFNSNTAVNLRGTFLNPTNKEGSSYYEVNKLGTPYGEYNYYGEGAGIQDFKSVILSKKFKEENPELWSRLEGGEQYIEKYKKAGNNGSLPEEPGQYYKINPAFKRAVSIINKGDADNVLIVERLRTRYNTDLGQMYLDQFKENDQKIIDSYNSYNSQYTAAEDELNAYIDNITSVNTNINDSRAQVAEDYNTRMGNISNTLSGLFG